ncbi:NAD(P)-binding protein [Pyxidicoccus caerfyrddinensis]|uniref:NAD(P)-binding protein n=1 Tax=Pyxidicoccus caerfyrddinensis TaxID=2709663 RepID=UPI0013D93BC9|nr:NAD(P)-binding protein [Pyxidicoccus caerfyrddinensis]
MDTLPSTHTRKGPARVHIYGAGIAGLTAAHELARRGFRVRIYEPAQEYDEMGVPETGPDTYDTDPRLAVGGMARSQFLRVAKGALGNFREQGQFTTCDEYRLVYDPSGDWLTTGLDPSRVFDFLHNRDFFPKAVFPGIVHIHHGMPSDIGRTPTRSDAAAALRDYMIGDRDEPRISPDRIIIVDEQEKQFAQEVEAPYPELGDKDELLVEVVHYLPGEHGFRFFPSYYRHLFSTMVETPILDDHGRPTGRRVFDNLVPSSFYGIAAQGRRIRFLRRAPASRPFEMLQELKDLFSSGYPQTDTLQFTLRLWRYLCTSPERRKHEYERISWWEYLEGYDPQSGTRRYQYSPAFKHDMQFAPRVLAAFDGAWGDARTNGNTLAQLYLNNLLPMPKTDGTLNGPTTPAWLRPWRRYLAEHLRVEFVPGRLTRFELQEDTLIPYVKTGDWEYPDTSVGKQHDEGEDPIEDPVDYYVLATDAVTAERLTEGLPEIGVVQGLRGFTTRIPPNPRGPEPEQPRTPGVLPGHVPWDRFQTLTGIQFFFPFSVRLAEGYLYFLDAPWGLSAINSQQYWATPPTLAQDGFAAVLSVDIGNWYVREPGQKSPSDSSRHEIAHEVWRQIKQATEQHQSPLSHAPQPQYSFVLPEPSWYSMDRHIHFEEDPATGKERPIENRAPYLIPILGDWDRRPGAEPWNPLAPSTAAPSEADLPKGLWQARHGGYQVHWGKLVFAGTYLKTFTRMTTMESANESARHAVNAIIDHCLAHPKPQENAPQRGVASTRATPTVPDYGGQGTLTGSPDFRMTPIGEYCRIWDPEQHELPELGSLRELDAKLFASGLPHVWDVLHLEPLVMPLVPSLASSSGAEALKSFLSRVRESLEAMPRPFWPGIRWPPH